MRSLIYSENRLFGQCLSHGLAAQPRIDFAQYSTDLNEIITLSQRHHVTSVLIDMGNESGAQAVKVLSRALPDICLLALSVDDRAPSVVIDCARLGCHGIVPQDARLEDVIKLVQAAERGEVTMRPDVVAQLMQALAAERMGSPPGLPECLTRREKEVCALVCEGLTNKEIAREINRSVGTVKNHVCSILSKLELPRRGAIHTYLHENVVRRVARG